MMKINLISGLCAIMLVACGAQAGYSITNRHDQQLSLENKFAPPVNESPTVTREETNIVDGINSFALDLYQENEKVTDDPFFTQLMLFALSSLCDRLCLRYSIIGNLVLGIGPSDGIIGISRSDLSTTIEIIVNPKVLARMTDYNNLQTPGPIPRAYYGYRREALV